MDRVVDRILCHLVLQCGDMLREELLNPRPVATVDAICKIGKERQEFFSVLLERFAAERNRGAAEVGVVFGYEDEIAPARAATKFAKENETFKVLQGVLEGKMLEAKEVLSLARLPTREQLLGQIAAALNAPIQGLVNVLQASIRNLVVVLNRIKDKK